MPDPITITIKNNGPYLISVEDAASVVIVDAAGQRYEPTPGKSIALCRCGHSLHKPFCDATHRTLGFQGALVVPPAPAFAGLPPDTPPSLPPAATGAVPSSDPAGVVAPSHTPK